MCKYVNVQMPAITSKIQQLPLLSASFAHLHIRISAY